MILTDIKVLVFDLDYTLIDSSEGIVYCFNEARKMVGEPVEDQEVLIKRIWLPIVQSFEASGSSDPPKMREIFAKIAREGAMAERSFLLPGVVETIPALKKKGYRLAVASTKFRPQIEGILEHLDIKNYFEEFVGSDEVELPKPAPDSLLEVMDRMGVGPGQTVYVGDHVVDVNAARSAGVRVIVVEGGPCAKDEIEALSPDCIISRISDILHIV